MKPSLAFAFALIATTALLGCSNIESTDESEDSEDVGQTQEAVLVHLGNITQHGTRVDFDKLTNVSGLDPQALVGIAACDAKALYAVRQRGFFFNGHITQYFDLFFSNDSGQTWADTGFDALSAEIACDHSQLATLDASGRLWVARTAFNGALVPSVLSSGYLANPPTGVTGQTWIQSPTATTVNRIQGGDGTFYGVKNASPLNRVYVASNRAIGLMPSWGSSIASVGSTQVTGTGATRTGTDNIAVADSLAWSRRAFDVETNGTLSVNQNLLAGTNTWTAINSGNERYFALTAAKPNLLFGLQNRSGTKEINRITITETNCSDGIDNDANGLTDGEDAECALQLAQNFCGNTNKLWCADRFQPSWFLDQPNQHSALVHCNYNNTPTIEPGVCERNPYATGGDYLLTFDSASNTPPDPPNTGRYCNVQWPDGSWGFDWTGADPCTTLLGWAANGKVVRAGLYSTTGINDVHIRCNNGWYGPISGIGTSPMMTANNAVGHTNNACIVSMSARKLPVFDKMFNSADSVPNRAVNPNCHNKSPVSLVQFGNNESGTSNCVDRFGFDAWNNFRENAYDHPLDEGRPVYAVGFGRVLASGGSRDRDISGNGAGNGSTNQSEVYVEYSVGTDPTYREKFVVYYAHLRKRLVVDNQTVKSGQILGYVGASGATGGVAHLHSGVFRLSNTNAHSAEFPELGYRQSFELAETGPGPGTNFSGTSLGTQGVVTNQIDPLGWGNLNAQDPWSYAEWNTDTGLGFFGFGAWSVDLFKPGAEFPYP